MTTRRVNIKTASYDIYIGRGSPYGNPFSHLPNTGAPYPVDCKEDAVRAYEYWVKEQPELITKIKQELKDKILGCYCYEQDICHGDVLIKIANSD